MYSRGKGAHKQKSEHCRPRQCDFKSAVCAVSSPVNVTSVNVHSILRTSPFQGETPTVRLAFGGCLQTLALFRSTHFLSLRAGKRGPQKILLYFWGKGVYKHKTTDCRLRRLPGQKRSIRRVAISRKGHRIIKPTQDTFVLAWRKRRTQTKE